MVNDVEDNIPDCGVAQRDVRPAYELLHDHTHQVRRHHQPHLRRRGNGGTTITSGAGDFGSATAQSGAFCPSEETRAPATMQSTQRSSPA
jgi:hypothetical protein